MADARAAIADVRLWYRTMEPAAGLVTPGWLDPRAVLERPAGPAR